MSLKSTADKLKKEFISKKINKEIAERDYEPEFKNILEEDHFISRYIGLYSSLTDAYPEYHFANSLFLLSLIADRRITINITPSKIYTNLWFFLLGLSTVSRKTTAINMGKILLNMSGMGEQLLPDDFTPEALIEYLSKESALKNRACVGFMRDEFGDFLAKLSKNYQLGMTGFMCTLFDNPDEYRKYLRSRQFDLKNVYMPFISATTPRALARHASVDDLETGYFARMLFIWPSRPKKSKRRRIISGKEAESQLELATWVVTLKSYIETLGDIEMEIDKEALEIWNNWYEEYEKFIIGGEKGEILSSFFGRLSNDVFKIACMFELGKKSTLETLKELTNIKNTFKTDTSPIHNTHHSHTYAMGVGVRELRTVNSVNCTKLKIGVDSMESAIYYATNQFIPSALKLIKYVERYVDTDKVENIFELAITQGAGGAIKHSRLLRFSHMKAKDFNDCVETLIMSGRFEKSTDDSGGLVYVPIKTDVDQKIPEFKRNGDKK